MSFLVQLFLVRIFFRVVTLNPFGVKKNGVREIRDQDKNSQTNKNI